ncbi:MAG: alpha/beta fold hydrolase [Gemmatimonadales bacterium]
MRACPPFLLALVAITVPPVTVAQQPSQSGEFVASDGVRIHYLVRGSGRPLVLLHGFALSADLNWVGPGALDSLATAFTVIVPDFRGHGRSDKPHDPAAYGARFTEDVVELLDHLKIRKAHVAGYSMGGAIALKLLTTHPDRMRSAVLGGAGWQQPGSPPPPFIGDWLTNLDRAACEHTSVATALQRPDVKALPPPIVAALDRNDPAALAAVLRGAGAFAVPEADIRAIEVPVHAVFGERDEGARAQVDALARVVPPLTVTILPNADHAVAMAHPLLAAAIREFARAHQHGPKDREHPTSERPHRGK